MSEIPTDSQRLSDLAAAYDYDAAERDRRELSWRAPLLDRWAQQLAAGTRLIELGAGTGQAARYVADMGHEVTALDLSPGNVAKCRERGLISVVADMAKLDELQDDDFAPPYGAAFGINSLIHFPKAQLATALASIRSVLASGAPLLFTLWSGRSSEGRWDDDWTEPKRFFSFYDEDEARALFDAGWDRYESSSFSTLDNRGGLDLYGLAIELRAS